MSDVYTISKTFNFAAAHYLMELPPDHPCTRLHGHTYTVEVILRGPVNAAGMVRDYTDLKDIKGYLSGFDHRYLNEIVLFSPTVENLASHFLHTFRQWIPEVVAVRVSEGVTTWGECRIAE